MIDYLEQQVRKARERVHTLAIEHAQASGTLVALEDALMEARATEPPSSRRLKINEESKRFWMKPAWIAVLFSLSRRDQPFDLDELLEAARAMGLTTSDASAKSKISGYLSRGILTEVSAGLYKTNPETLNRVAVVIKRDGDLVGATEAPDEN